jgi:hypothetical protein
VYDRLEASATHAVSVRWPLHPLLDARVRAPGEVWAESSEGMRLLLAVAATTVGSISVARGERSPLAGWWSPRLERLVPAPLVKWETTFAGRLDVATILCPVTTALRPLLELTLRRQAAAAQLTLSSAAGRRVVLDFDGARVSIRRGAQDRRISKAEEKR